MSTPSAAGKTVDSLTAQVLLECEAMARYALASGMTVPAGVARLIENELQSSRGSEPQGGPAPEGGKPAGDGSTRARLDSLINAHDKLAALVAPATPRTILLLSQRGDSWLAPLGPVRFIRQMLVIVIVLLTGFVLLATSSEINARSGDIFNSSGTELLLNELFFLAAGGMGAAFAALFTAYRYIAAGTYDPKYESTYWIQFILGLMAGLLLPALIPIGGGEDGSSVTKPLLALVGGFSASVLYRILDRLVSTVDSLVSGGGGAASSATTEVEVARVSTRVAQERLGLAGELMKLRERTRANDDPAEIARELERIVDGLVPTAPGAPDAWDGEAEREPPGRPPAETASGGTPPGDRDSARPATRPAEAESSPAAEAPADGDGR